MYSELLTSKLNSKLPSSFPPIILKSILDPSGSVTLTSETNFLISRATSPPSFSFTLALCTSNSGGKLTTVTSSAGFSNTVTAKLKSALHVPETLLEATLIIVLPAEVVENSTINLSRLSEAVATSLFSLVTKKLKLEELTSANKLLNGIDLSSEP